METIKYVLIICIMVDNGRPVIAQLVERRTVDATVILRSVVQIRLTGALFPHLIAFISRYQNIPVGVIHYHW